MKGKTILIIVAIIAAIIAAYFLLRPKSATDDKTVTTTTSSNTGVSALLNTGAMGSLFGGLLGGTKSAAPATNALNTSTASPTTTDRPASTPRS